MAILSTHTHTHTQEVEIGSIVVQSKFIEKVSETPPPAQPTIQVGWYIPVIPTTERHR
jgi:hypothetical protein